MGGCEVGCGKEVAMRGCAVEIGIIRGWQGASMQLASSGANCQSALTAPARTSMVL